MMEALGTQLAGHVHVKVWDWTLVYGDDIATHQRRLKAGELGMVSDLLPLNPHPSLMGN